MNQDKPLEQRIRQLLAIDKNAVDIYRELAEMANKNEDKEIFKKIAVEEERHVNYSLAMLSLLSGQKTGA